MPIDPTPTTSTTLINGVGYNETALKHWNYTAYSNGTLSNGSNCFLTFGAYKPILLSPNGTFTNTTSCYTPLNPIGARGITGLIFGSLFAFSILFSTINLRKHGRAYLPRDKRWKPVGRRWPWYWTIIVAACGILSSFPAVDVDRDYIVNLPMILQCFFLTLTTPVLLACVWEAVRSWSSFSHRRLRDVDAFAFAPHDFREKVDFYLPLIFYAFDAVVFFLLIPRSWSFAQRQRSPTQIMESAKSMALDARFKAASALATACLALIVFRLGSGSQVYQTRIPPTLLLIALLLAVRLAYGLAGSWVWALSPYRLHLHAGWLYGLGYAPTLLIVILLNIRGYLNENEDKILIAQRASRGSELGSGIHVAALQGNKIRGQGRRDTPPSWWLKPRHATAFSSRTLDIPQSSSINHSGTDPRAAPSNLTGQQDESGHYWWQRRKEGEVDARHRKPRHGTTQPGVWRSLGGESDTTSMNARWTERDGPMQPPSDNRNPDERRDDSSSHGVYGQPQFEGSVPTSSTHSLQSAPQVVRSMLDV